MRPKPFAEVEIIHEDAKLGVRAGQRGYLLEWLRDPKGGEDGALVELHGASGRDDPTVIVPQSWVRAVSAAGATDLSPPKKRAS